MILNRNLNLIPTHENKTRVFPRREDAEGSHQLRMGGQEIFMFTHLLMWDPSLALRMTEDRRPQSAIL
jgi:hypothetical protein